MSSENAITAPCDGVVAMGAFDLLRLSIARHVRANLIDLKRPPASNVSATLSLHWSLLKVKINIEATLCVVTDLALRISIHSMARKSLSPLRFFSTVHGCSPVKIASVPSTAG